MHHRPGGFHGNRPHSRFVLAEETGVDLDGGLMLRREVDIFEDRIHRANDLALLAIDTYFRVDVELRRTWLRVDTGDLTNLDTRSVVGAQTCDDVRHCCYSYVGFKTFKWFKQFKTSGTFGTA